MDFVLICIQDKTKQQYKDNKEGKGDFYETCRNQKESVGIDDIYFYSVQRFVGQQTRSGKCRSSSERDI